VLKPGERSGHDIEVTLRIDAGVPFADPTSPSHWISIKRDGQAKATVTLDARDRIPNKDLIVRYNVRGKAPAFGAVTYSEGADGYFLLLLAPKAKYDKNEIIPREVLFVVDSSGSQQGDPLAKSKDVVKRALKALRADDTFQVFNFNDIINSMAPGPVPATAENIANAKKFIDEIKATGGTRMLPAVQAALNWPADPKRLRILVMTTDGYIGNESEIIGEIHKSLGDARLFMFGCGSSVNRYLIDRMAEEGRGYASYVRQDEAADKVIDTFTKRLDAPVLRDLDIDWRGLSVADVYPAKIPDLYAGQPVTVFGRFTKPGAATIELRGKQGNGHVALSLPVNFPNHKAGSNQLASLWARARIEKLMGELEVGVGQRGALENEVTDLGLRYRLMTQFTSFVAVEEQVRNVGGQQQTVQVPVEMPEGVSYDGVFGVKEEAAERKAMGGKMMANQPMAPPPPPALASPSPSKPAGGSGLGYGSAGAVGRSIAAGDKALTEQTARFNLDPVAFLGVADPAPLAKSLRDEVARKLDDALKGAPLPSGKSLMIKLTLKADGRVDAVEIMKDEAGSAELTAKVKAVLLKAKLAATGGKAEVIFFLHF
jgi:Ca-activated chloride channel family protein